MVDLEQGSITEMASLRKGSRGKTTIMGDMKLGNHMIYTLVVTL